MKPLTGTFLIAALSIAGMGAIGCDSTKPTAKPTANVAAATGSVTFYVEGMI